MDLMKSFALSAGGLAVQKARMEIASENMANVSSTRTPEGGPYRKKEIAVSAVPLSFEASLGSLLGREDIQTAEVASVQRSNEPPQIVHDPSHPDADEAGNVAMPTVNIMEEMINMMTATKAYEANITSINATKSMILRTLNIGGE